MKLRLLEMGARIDRKAELVRFLAWVEEEDGPEVCAACEKALSQESELVDPFLVLHKVRSQHDALLQEERASIQQLHFSV